MDTTYNPVERAYNILMSIRELDPAIEEAIGYLGEALDDHPEVEE